MAGIMDFLRNMTPEQNNALLTAGSQILMRSGPGRPFSVGQAMGTGGVAYQDSIAEQQARAQQTRMQDLQIRGVEGDMAAQERARLEQEQTDAAIRSGLGTPGQQAASLPGGPTAGNAARIPEMQGGMNVDAAVAALMQVNPRLALEFKRKYSPAPEEYDTTPRTANDEVTGKPFQYVMSKTGKMKRLDGVLPREEMKLASLGDRDEVYNPYALQPGQMFQRGVSPDTRANNAVAIRSQNMVDARSREANANSRGLMNEERQLRIDALRGKADERQLSKQGSMSNLLTQVSVIDKALAHPGRTTSTGASGVIDPRNYLPGTDATDFRVVADQLSGGAFLQAFESLKGAGQITEIEGQKATQAIARLNRAQSDSEYQTALLDLRGVINSGVERMGGKPAPLPEAYAAGAAKQGAAPRKSAIKGQILDGHRFKGGNPADPNAWEKL